jgi:hypothetical protein
VNLLLRRAERLLLWGEFDSAYQTLAECLNRLRRDRATALAEIDPGVYRRFRVVLASCQRRDRMLYQIYARQPGGF